MSSATYMRKKIPQLNLAKCLFFCLSSCLSHDSSSHFCLENIMSPANKFNSQSACVEKKITLKVSPPNRDFMNFPPENSLHPRKWVSQTASSLLMVMM